jgi:hypothetical protein
MRLEAEDPRLSVFLRPLPHPRARLQDPPEADHRRPEPRPRGLEPVPAPLRPRVLAHTRKGIPADPRDDFGALQYPPLQDDAHPVHFLHLVGERLDRRHQPR